MGLDNGFYVKSNKRPITRDVLPKNLQYPFEKDYAEDKVEIVYWRKNWGLRNAVLNLLGERLSEETYFDIDTPATVIEIIGIIGSFLDSEKWESEGNSIWDAAEVRPWLIRDIISLAIIYAFMLENPDVYLEFYDSY